MSRVNHRSALSTLAASLILTSLLSGCQTIPGLSRSTPVATPCPWTADGEGFSRNFGYSVDAAGDVDGDGYADIVIGADRYKQFTGRADIYAGGPTGLSASPVFVATGESANNHFGYSVAGAGDVDGDGQAEVIVGAYGHDNWTGRAYVPCTPGDG